MRRTPSDRSARGRTPSEADLYWRDKATPAGHGAAPAAIVLLVAALLLL